MVLHYVAQCACCLIKGSAAFNADTLRGRDLDVVDVVAVPHVFEDAIGKTEHQNVLHRLFAKVVVDAKDLIFTEHLVHLVVQRPSRLQIVAERLFDDNADPVFSVAAICGPRHAMVSQVLNDVREVLRRSSKVEEAIAPGTKLRVDLG